MKTKQQYRLTYIFVVGLLVAAWVFGPSNVNADVPVSDLGGNESEVSIAINPKNPDNLVIVGHSPGPKFRFMNTFVTRNGGKGWAQKSLGPAHDKGRGTGPPERFDPTVAFDDNGNVYVAYGISEVKPIKQTKLVVCKSISQSINKRSLAGYRYESPCTVVATTPDIGTLHGNDKWHLATGPDPFNPAQQNVYIAWTQNVQEGADTDQRIVLSRSTDGGKKFSAPVIVNDDSITGIGRALFADPAVGPNGEVYVSWIDLATGKIFVDLSRDGGVAFGTDNPVTTINPAFAAGGLIGLNVPIPAQPERGVHAGPNIDVDRTGGLFDGRLYITYVDIDPTSAHPDTDIFVRFSKNNGKDWSDPPTRVNDDAGTKSQFLPWLDLDQKSGTVGVVWYDARDDDPDNKKVEVFLGVSTDGGATFPRNILVSDRPSNQSVDNPRRFNPQNFLEYIGLAIFNCEAFVVWADNSTTTNRADLAFFGDRVPNLCD